MVANPNPPLLSVREAAARACVSSSLVYAWCAQGRLPHLRVGAAGRRGKILIKPAALDELLESFKVGVTPASPALPQPSPPSAFTHLRFD